ncbi:MAG: hypothetical protein AAF483_22225 [Planctomycetota bacterium]
MLESYRKLIESEPNELTWRSGLTQILLEKGKDQEARDLWRDFVQSSERGSTLLLSAQALGEFGLDDLAKTTIERMVSLELLPGQALLYWSDLKSRRGEVEEAEETLNRIQSMENMGDDVKAELASAYERLGRQDKAIEVNEAIRASRETVAEDLEMRLAWLYSEVGDEEKALEQWLALWKKITSIPRRRYVEDRLMTVASRLGTLADIAIELEEKLADGTADDREAGLLVRIYSRVNDAVAATEISEDYMARTGKNEVEQLQEKGRIYQICNDYWNYEKVVEQLIDVDPEGETEYLRQLALSMLERGKAQEAREVLMTLRDADDGKDSIGGEFEAGVLSLVGMNKEAAQAYRKGIATYPDRIESYLLLANLLKQMGLTDRAVGMFQYLAENAERDDLFTIAIDGILNMEARGPAMQWARRITLERLAGREDKNYLYQLLADLSVEVNDKNGQIRALENSLAVSGTRRLSVLRECMELSSRIRGGVYYSGSSRGPTNKGNQPFFAFGRRLIGLGELMPPQVFLDLGQAFLDDGDTQSAIRTFSMARNLADPRGYQREVALIFEKAGKASEALTRNDKLLRTSPSDVALIARVAKLNEQEGKDDIAYRFYRRGLDLLLAQTPLTTQEESGNQQVSYWSSNRDAYQTYSQQLLQGVLVSLPDDQSEKLIAEQLGQIKKSFDDLKRVAEAGRTAEKLADSPRIQKLGELTRSICFALNDIDALEELDSMLLEQFQTDKRLLLQFARERKSRGRYDSIQRLLETGNPDEGQSSQLKQMLGKSSNESASAKLSPQEMWQRLLPVWMKGDRQAALAILRRVNQRSGRSPGMGASYIIVNGMAVMQSSSGASDVTAWMRLAMMLEDEGLALQFARSMMKTGGRYSGPQFRQQLTSVREILPEKAYGDFIRYAANTIKEDKNRVADYLWLLTKESEYLKEQVPDDDALLELIEAGNLEIGYYFPFSLALEVFPESIRSEALSSVMSSIVDKYRPRELIQVPFQSEQAIDAETADVVLEWLESGIEPAMQDNYLRYCTYNLPRQGTAVRNPANTEFALKALDLLLTDRVRKQEKDVPRLATYVKAVVLHQAGRTEEALEQVLKDYDPEENVTDYYTRNAQTWVYSELVPVATERFLAKLSEGQEDGKPTVAITDKKISMVTQAGNEELLRKTYRQAIKDHPDQRKYNSNYERWEQRLKRNLVVIDMLEQQIADASKAEEQAKTDDEKAKAKTISARIPSLKKRLVTLWKGVNNLPKALPHWIEEDDQDIARFESEKKARAEEAKRPRPPSPNTTRGAIQPKANGKPQLANSPEPDANAKAKALGVTMRIAAGNLPASLPPQLLQALQQQGTALAQPASTTSADGKKKTYAKSMAGVKAALDDENEKAAKETLRKIWRTFPPVVAGPYNYGVQRPRVNGLSWPATANARPDQKSDSKKPEDKPKELTDDEKNALAAKKKAEARLKARGGIASFTPPEPTKRKKPDSAWKKLADYPFAVSEMERIMRSQVTPVKNTVQDVSFGLLQAERNEKGDEAVFESLVQKIHAGHLSDQVLAFFFVMLEEDWSRINDDNKSVVDVLLDRLDLTNGRRASQLAELCGRVGQKDRSKALYRHCALLSTTNATNYANLITQAKNCFEGDELLVLVEEMYTLTKRGPAEIIQLIKIRQELMKPEEAAEKSVALLEGQLETNEVLQIQLAVAAAPVYSKVKQYDAAQRCLAFLLDKTGEAKAVPNDPYRSVVYTGNNPRNQLQTSRLDLIKLFPEKPEDYQDYAEWLREAAELAVEKIDSAKPVFAAEVLLTIGLRQCELDLIDDAKQTLGNLSADLLKDAKTLHPLAMDIFHLAKMPKAALELEQSAFDNLSLNHLRFGDLLRDKANVDGREAATALLKELVEYSMDDDLLAAAVEVAGENKDLLAMAETFSSTAKEAQAEYDKRTKAANERKSQRAKWKQEDTPPKPKKAGKKPENAAARGAIPAAGLIPAKGVPAIQIRKTP